MTKEEDYASQRYHAEGQGPGNPEWNAWATTFVRDTITKHFLRLSRPLSKGTCSLLVPTIFKTGRLDRPSDVLWVLKDAIKNRTIGEVTNAFDSGWKLSNYDSRLARNTASDKMVYAQGLASDIFLDDEHGWCFVVNQLGQEQSWRLNPSAQQEANAQSRQQFDDKERARLIAELTGNNAHGFSVIVPIGDAKSGWTTKKVGYDAQGRELKPDLQGFSKSGWMPRRGDEGFADPVAMPTSRIREFVEQVNLQNNLDSQSVPDLRKTTKDLRAGVPTVFGAEMVAQQTKTNDDLLFQSESGYELNRAEVLWLAKNNLDKFRALMKRDAGRINRILGAK